MRFEISGTRSVYRREYMREASQLVTARGVGPSNIKDGRIVYRRQKAAKNPFGVLVDIPMHPHLREAIEASPVTFTYLETRQGKASSRKGLGTLCANGATRRACPFVRLMGCARRSVAGLLRRAVHRSR